MTAIAPKPIVQDLMKIPATSDKFVEHFKQIRGARADLLAFFMSLVSLKHLNEHEENVTKVRIRHAVLVIEAAINDVIKGIKSSAVSVVKALDVMRERYATVKVLDVVSGQYVVKPDCDEIAHIERVKASIESKLHVFDSVLYPINALYDLAGELTKIVKKFELKYVELDDVGLKYIEQLTDANITLQCVKDHVEMIYNKVTKNELLLAVPEEFYTLFDTVIARFNDALYDRVRIPRCECETKGLDRKCECSDPRMYVDFTGATLLIKSTGECVSVRMINDELNFYGAWSSTYPFNGIFGMDLPDIVDCVMCCIRNARRIELKLLKIKAEEEKCERDLFNI